MFPKEKIILLWLMFSITKEKIITRFSIIFFVIGFVFFVFPDSDSNLKISMGDFLQVISTLGVLWIVVFLEEKNNKSSASSFIIHADPNILEFLIKNDSSINSLFNFILELKFSSDKIDVGAISLNAAGILKEISGYRGDFVLTSVAPITILDHKITQVFLPNLKSGDELIMELHLSGGNLSKHILKKWKVSSPSNGIVIYKEIS